MDIRWWIALAILLGIVLGIGLSALYVYFRERGVRINEVVNPSLPDGVDEVLLAIDSLGIVVDYSLNVVRATPGALRLGLVKGHEIAFEQLIQLVIQVQESGEALNAQVTLTRESMALPDLHLTVRVSPLGMRYHMLLVRDVTEARRVEETRADFIVNVSHELKTPIGAIKLLAEAIESAKDDPATVERFQNKLMLEVDRIDHLTRDLLELSRLQSAVEPSHTDPVSLSEVVQLAVQQNRVGAAARKIDLVVGDSIQAEVLGDTAQLVSAVSNLISNAINYSPEGSRVGIGFKETGDQYQIAITDQGVGIPKTEQARIFERFYRVSQARDRNSGGTGVGLSIVKHVVRIHGGDVKLWSQPNLGSTFTICLPKVDTLMSERE